MKTALITGISGQDGAYLAQLLLGKGYRVVGLTRSNHAANFQGLQYLGIRADVEVAEVDLLDFSQVISVVKRTLPSEIYNLAAQSSVSMSFQQPIGTIHFNIISVLHLLEAIKLVDPGIRFYQASSSEMYGRVERLPITEERPLHPLSPYAISKASAHWATVNYRESFGLYTACGVLFNHESYLRPPGFFVKKVLKTALDIQKGAQKQLSVGNIDIRRDFGYAPRYVEAMWLMLQQTEPRDYLISSGHSITLRSIVEHVFERLSIAPECLVVDPALYRPTEIEDIYGDPALARGLGWDYNIDFYQVLDWLLEEEQRNGAPMSR
jgi:GDPmannose 4,6-dehydratase